MPQQLPPRANLDHLKNQAKALLRAYRESDPQAVARFRELLSPSAKPKLADAQRLIARQYGFASWPKLKARISASPQPNPLELAKLALKNDDADALRQLLSTHPELKQLINEPLAPFDSPIIVCISSRAMLDVLLDAGADINARSRWWAGGFGILDNCDPALAQYAIHRGATITVHAAARLGMFDHLRQLIRVNPALVHAPGGDGQTPLHFASTVEIAQFLLDNGANIDARDVDHESTPAQWMIRERQDIARFLVARGCQTDILMAAALGDIELVRKHLDADPASIRTSVSDHYFPKQNPRSGGTIYIWTLGQNKTPHQLAKEFGHNDIFQLLMDRSPLELKLATAAALGDEATLNSMTAAGPINPQTLSDNDRRKLVDAAQSNDLNAVTLLLKSGWPIDAHGQHGGTAVHWAAWHGNANMVRELLRYHPPLEDAKNEFNATPLGWATHGSEHGWHRKTGDYPSTVKLLCLAGAKLPNELSGTDEVRAALRPHLQSR
jgi:ankyrin repeat protein